MTIENLTTDRQVISLLKKTFKNKLIIQDNSNACWWSEKITLTFDKFELSMFYIHDIISCIDIEFYDCGDIPNDIFAHPSYRVSLYELWILIEEWPDVFLDFYIKNNFDKDYTLLGWSNYSWYKTSFSTTEDYEIVDNLVQNKISINNIFEEDQKNHGDIKRKYVNFFPWTNLAPCYFDYYEKRYGFTLLGVLYRSDRFTLWLFWYISNWKMMKDDSKVYIGEISNGNQVIDDFLCGVWYDPANDKFPLIEHILLNKLGVEYPKKYYWDTVASWDETRFFVDRSIKTETEFNWYLNVCNNYISKKKEVVNIIEDLKCISSKNNKVLQLEKMKMDIDAELNYLKRDPL